MKKCLALLLAAALLLGCFAGTAFALEGLLGDVDGDGKYAATDARLALRAAVKLETLTEEQTARADVDYSGTVTAQDARTILRASVKLEELDPATGLFVPVQVTSPAEKLRTYLRESATHEENGSYYYGIATDYAKYIFVLDTTGEDEYPFGVWVMAETEGLEYGAYVWFNEDFTLYFVDFDVYEGSECLLSAEYDIAPAALCLETASSALTEYYYDGDTSVQDQIKQLAGSMAVSALLALKSELEEHNVGVDYKNDMHLPRLMEIPAE